MLVTSLKSPKDVYSKTGMLWPERPTTENYSYVINRTEALIWMRNSAEIALMSSLIAMIVSTLGAYALVRLRVPGKTVVIRLIVLSYLVPAALMFIPMFIIMYEFGLYNTRLGLVLAYASASTPFMVWFLMGYIKTVPEDLEDAAQVDGCSRLEVFRRIVLPLIMPGSIAAGIFAFTNAWNEFLLATVLIAKSDLRTVPLGLATFIDTDVVLWGPLMTMAFMSTVPAIVLYMFAQRYLVTGMTAGAVKG
jgi:multiple sugar transport system permease protein